MNEPALQPMTIGGAPAPAERDVNDNKDLAALGYAWVLVFVAFLAQRKSPFVRFHTKQGFVLFVMSILVWFIPFVGHALEVVIIAAMVWGFINATKGTWRDIPLVGPLSRGDVQGVRRHWQEGVHWIVRVMADLRRSFGSKRPPHSPK